MKIKLKKSDLIIILVLSAIVGILMVLFSGNTNKADAVDTTKVFSEADYTESLEKRLKSIIEDIEGVGQVSVMITIEGSQIFSYATDVSQDTKADGDYKRESTIVLTAGGTNTKSPIVSGYKLPEIKGAAIVCSKRISPTLQAKVIGVASAALGISTSKIYVTN